MKPRTLSSIGAQLVTLGERLKKQSERWPSLPTGGNRRDAAQWKRHETVWAYEVEAGKLLWDAFECDYDRLDGRLRSMIGARRGSGHSHNPRSAHGRTFQTVFSTWPMSGLPKPAYPWDVMIALGEYLKRLDEPES